MSGFFPHQHRGYFLLRHSVRMLLSSQSHESGYVRKHRVTIQHSFAHYTPWTCNTAVSSPPPPHLFSAKHHSSVHSGAGDEYSGGEVSVWGVLLGNHVPPPHLT